jgi:aspartate racemase
MHIGLIGGIGPAATEYYYRGLVARSIAVSKPLELTIVQAHAPELAKNAADGASRSQAAIFARLIDRLAAAGAEAAAITSMGGHFCIADLLPLSPLPLISAIPVIGNAIQQAGIKTIGLLGTRTVMAGRLYGGLTSATVVVPEGESLEQIHKHYIAMALSGQVTDEQRRDLFAAGQKMCRDQGAEAVLLAGTDLFLAFAGHDCGFPTLDAADIHIDALHQVAMTTT